MYFRRSRTLVRCRLSARFYVRFIGGLIYYQVAQFGMIIARKIPACASRYFFVRAFNFGLQLRYWRNNFETHSHKMLLPHKQKTSHRSLKVAIIRRFGTIAAFAKHHGRSQGTVYSAISFRRNGPIAEAIRQEARR